MVTSKQELSTNELLVLNSALRGTEKSLAIGYLMLLGGHLGVHRFYLKQFRTGIVQLVMFVLASLIYLVGVVALESDATVFFDNSNDLSIIVCFILFILIGGALFVWIVIDMFRLPRMIRDYNEGVEQDILSQIVKYRNENIRTN